MREQSLDCTVSSILEWHRNGFLTPNPEYQRGLVWDAKQERLLIDSILRGYPIPLFYFHFKRTEAAGLSRQTYEIIDGQQRINAICKFANNGLRLPDPQNDRRTGLPKFLAEQPCAWAGKWFNDLDPVYREAFLKTSLRAVSIETEDENEARDLFIRLQAGLPLTPQEKRDAWPGNFSQFVIQMAGKPGLATGHEFFQELVTGAAGRRGGVKMRQTCAQVFIIFYTTRRMEDPFAFVSLNSKNIDEFYHYHVNFNPQDPDSQAKRFTEVLDLAYRILRGRPALKIHSALHSILLMDSLLDSFRPDWQTRFAGALDTFLTRLSVATRSQDRQNEYYEYWSEYGQWARTSSMAKDIIQRRHLFFLKETLPLLKPLTRIDPQRSFSREERELLYFSQKRNCAICGRFVDWPEAEAHHRVPHADGGITTLENAVLVHRRCHPRGPQTGMAEPGDQVPWVIQHQEQTPVDQPDITTNGHHITEDELIPVLLKLLLRHEGRAPKTVVEDEIYAMFPEEFEKEWYNKKVKSGAPRWKNYIAWAKQRAKTRGWMKGADESGRGIWKLTEQGMEEARRRSVST